MNQEPGFPGILAIHGGEYVNFATLVPQGNPRDANDGVPVLDKVNGPLDLVETGPRRHIHSVASDLGLNDPALRQARHARGIFTVGIPKTVEPIKVHPEAQDGLSILNEAGFNRIRTPHHVHLACASGSSRPVVESHIASVLARGAGQGRYKGFEGAVLQQGTTVMAHNGAVVVRIRQLRLSKRAQKFRRMPGLKSLNTNKINHQKNS